MATSAAGRSVDHAWSRGFSRGGPSFPPYNLNVAEPVPTTTREEAPPLDPEAVERAYRFHRAKRAAREHYSRERRWASFRFWIGLVLVLAAGALLAARTLGEIERVFGL